MLVSDELSGVDQCVAAVHYCGDIVKQYTDFIWNLPIHEC